MRIVYLRIGVTEVVGLAGVTEVVGLAGVTEVVGLAGGLEAQVTIEDQQKWDGKGSPPGAVGKSGTPPTINTAD